jgi:hypothetical protein
MQKKMPGYPYVRCQVPPDVADVVGQVARAMDWNKPAVYMAMICYVSEHIGAVNFTLILRQMLSRLEAESDDPIMDPRLAAALDDEAAHAR